MPVMQAFSYDIKGNILKSRVYNFSAGPPVLPEQVLKEQKKCLITRDAV